jgi:cytochrome c oxidase cbb3-type subunit 4
MMETYTLLRAFADSWFLVAMCAFFVGASLWAFWPSQRAARADAANIPFKENGTDTLEGQTHD